MKFSKAVIVGGFAASLGVAQAAQPKYGMAGCGAGGMLMEGKHDKVMQVIASIVNEYVGFQTSSITSGTAGCKTEGLPADFFAKTFIDANRSNLEVEIARGEGQSLTTLAEVMGCQDAAWVSSKLQSSYGEIFPTSQRTTDQVYSDITNVLKQDAQSKAACAKLI